MPISNQEKHDRIMRTPDLLTQTDFEHDQDPENEFSPTEEIKRQMAYEKVFRYSPIKYRPHRSL